MPRRARVHCAAGLVMLSLLHRSRQRHKMLPAPLIPLEKNSTHSIRELSSAEIEPSEIVICKRPDGSDWLLGQGNFGKVGLRRIPLQGRQVLTQCLVCVVCIRRCSRASAGVQQRWLSSS